MYFFNQVMADKFKVLRFIWQITKRHKTNHDKVILLLIEILRDMKSENGFHFNGVEHTWGQLIRNKEFSDLTSISSSTLRKWSHYEDFVNFIAS